MTLDADTALQLARDAYSASTTYFDASIRREVEADLRRFQGLHPTGSKYLSDGYKAKSRLFRPKTRATLRKHEAVAAEAFFSTRDVVNIEPQDDNDNVQKASAALHKELLQHRLTKTIPWFLTVMGAYQESMNVGIVCSYQHWVFDKKKKKDEPCVRLIPIENVRFDPGANWMDPVNTSPYFIELVPMYVKDVKARMTTADDKTGEAKWLTVDEATILTAVRGYSDSTRLQREAGRTDSKENVTAVRAYSVVWVHKNIVEHDGVDYCYYTLGEHAMLSKPVPLADRYHHGKRPYVIGYSVIEAHKNFPGGPNRLGKDIQAEINEVANQRIENVKLVLNKRYLVGRNRLVDIRSLTRNIAGSATLVNDTEKDVKPLDFVDVTASSYKEQEVLNLDHDEVTGNFSQSSVQSNRRMNETVGGMEMLSTDANQVGGYQLRTFTETWVEPVLRQLILLEQAYETDEVILALAGQKAKLDELGFDTVTDELIEQELILSVSVGMGATNPTEKVNRLLTAMRSLKEMLGDGLLQQYGLDFHEVATEVFGNLGYKDGSRFFTSDEQEDPRVQQMQQELAKLQAALDAKFPPELLAAQVKEIEARVKLLGSQATKTGVDASFSAMQAAEVVAAVPQAAPVADALLQAAGWTPPTPKGQDPNIPTATAPTNPTSGAAAVAPVGGVPQVTQGDVSGGAPGDTSPNTPAKPTPQGGAAGAGKGIETQESDSVSGQQVPNKPPGFANGGLVDDLGAEVEFNSILGKQADMRTPQEQALVDKDSQRIEADNRRMYPEAYGAKAHVGINLATAGLTDGTIAEMTAQGAFGRRRARRVTGAFEGYADGGLIQGPGTGTSDSIPAVNTDTGAPLAVSNNEFKVSPAVVQAMGKDFFDNLIAQYHTPVPGQPPIYQAKGPMDEPLGMQTGTVIIPEDVVQALGVDFFERLEQMYGGGAQ